MAERKQVPTLKTISELTGLAVPTISRALSGAEDIGEKTRKRVREVANEIGYVPNRAGVRLRTGRSFVISLVLPTEADVMNVTARLINSAASALRNTRYHLTITPVFPDEDPLRPIQKIVEMRTADGVILNQVETDDARVRYLLGQEFPFATHGRSKWSDKHDFYDFDTYSYAQIAVARLVERGRRNLGLIAPPQRQFYAQEMIRGARDAAAAAGVTLTVLEDITSDSPSERIEAAMRMTQARSAPLDGVICASSACCLAAVIGIESLGQTVGQDIDFFSKEAIPFLSRFRGAILTQFEDASAAGSFLAQAVLNRIEKPNTPVMHKLDVPQPTQSLRSQ